MRSSCTQFEVATAPQCRVSYKIFILFHCPLDGKQFIFSASGLISIIPTLQQDPFLKQFCLEDMYSCSSDYLWYPYYPEYHSYCYQNVISRDNTRLSLADNINWLGCIIASSGVNLNIRFDPDERLKWNFMLNGVVLRQ